jgi:U3 small nucleolar RNA-associated protein 13
VSGGSDKLLKVWDLSAIPAALQQLNNNDGEDGSEEGEEEGKDSIIIKLKVTAAVAAHDKDINTIAISPNNKLVVSGSQDKTANIWHLPSLVSASPPLKGHKRGIWSVAFSPLDQAVATASGDKTVRIWSLQDGSCLRVLEGHLSSVLRVCFTSAGMQLLSSGGDGLIKLWSVRSSECISTFDGHDDKVWALAPLMTTGAADSCDNNNTTKSDARLIASGGGDGSIVLWEDCTSEDALVAAKEREAAILGEQALANALAGEKYADAAVMALKMRHPGRLLSVIRRVTENNNPEQAHITITDILTTLKKKNTIKNSNNGGDDGDNTEHHNNKNEELRQLLEYCKDWNTNAKTCSAAQAVMYSLFKAYSPEELLSTPGVSAVLDALVPYSQRHFKRADRLLRGTFLVDFILGSGVHTLNPDDDDSGGVSENGKSHNDADDDNEEKGKKSDKKTKKRKAGS